MSRLTRHLKERHFTDALIELFRPALDEDENFVTFYLYNLTGQCIGYQHYRPGHSKTQSNHPKESRYYTYRPKSKEAVAIGGLETYHFSDVLFVVEGLFDAVRLWANGYACVWTCGIPDKQVQHWLKVQPKPTIAILDPDGQSGIHRAFKRSCDVVVHVEEYNSTTDLGDATDTQVSSAIMVSMSKLFGANK